MKYTDLGSFFNVSVSAQEVANFNESWPCSRLPEKRITFQFQKSNGDLVDIWPDSSRFDGPELLALCEDAQEYGNAQLATVSEIELPIREFNRLTKGWPYAGCMGEDILSFIDSHLNPQPATLSA